MTRGGGRGGRMGGGRGGRMGGGGGNNAPVDRSELSKSVDFWEKYYLAKWQLWMVSSEFLLTIDYSPLTIHHSPHYSTLYL